MTKLINNFDQISDNYRAIFCDLWGCLHNGRISFSESLSALARFRKAGGVVILLTNAPRPKNNVYDYIDRLGISTHYYDDLITSGDAARLALFSGKFGTKICHIGPSRDLCFFEKMEKENDKCTKIKLVSINEATCILCTGLFNDKTEHPADYKNIIKTGVTRGLKFLCANPDIQVDYGETRLWCAGALAALYTKEGGHSVYFGKPHKPIYDLALERLKLIIPNINAHEVLCVGDGIYTDILGGSKYNMETLFLCNGLARDKISINPLTHLPDGKELQNFLDDSGVKPTLVMSHLK